MRRMSQAATKLRRGSPVSDGKLGVSYTRPIQFAAPPMAKRHKTNFTHKDSLPQHACHLFLDDDSGDEISPPPLEGEQKAASGRRLSYAKRISPTKIRCRSTRAISFLTTTAETKSPHLPWRGSKRRPPAAVFRTKNADAKHRLWREARRVG